MIKAPAMLAALAAGLTLAGCGGGSDDATPAETGPATTQAAEIETAPATTSATTAPSEATTGAEPAAEVETTTEAGTTADTVGQAAGGAVIAIVNGEPKGGVQTIRVKSGDEVQFVVRSDVPEEVHVHGYDLSKDVGPGQDAVFAFPADIEGIFEVELENSAVQIIELVVGP